MRSRFHVPASRTRFALVTLGLVLVTLAAVAARRATDPTSTAMVCTPAGAMSDTQMASLSAAHYASTPAHGAAATATTAVVAATFTVTNYQFDADGDPSTIADVVHILPGQGVMFKWVAGIHTSTSGNPNDFDAGSIWDIPVNSTHQQTVITFPTPGTYPFHCLFHGDYFGMVGTVVVDPNVTPTASTTWGKLKSRYR